jgi:hypothetical protein
LGRLRCIPLAGDEQERHSVMAETCFATNAGIRPSMPTTIAIRPLRAPARCSRRRLLAPSKASVWSTGADAPRRVPQRTPNGTSTPQSRRFVAPRGAMCRKPGSVMCAADRASNETRLHSPQHRNRCTYRPCTTRQRASGSSRRCERWPRGRPPFVPAPCSRPFASLTLVRNTGRRSDGVHYNEGAPPAGRGRGSRCAEAHG